MQHMLFKGQPVTGKKSCLILKPKFSEIACTEYGQQATRQYTYGSFNNSEEIGALHFYNINTKRK